MTIQQYFGDWCKVINLNDANAILKRLAASRQIIYPCLMESVIDFSLPHGSINFDPSLEKWESQGVLMLNAALSCIAGKTGSHISLWQPFIRSFLTNLSSHTNGIVYVLMGSEAQSLASCINSRYNHILKTKPLSWYIQNHQPMPSSLWHHINNILIGQNGYGIQWYETN